MLLFLPNFPLVIRGLSAGDFLHTQSILSVAGPADILCSPTAPWLHHETAGDGGDGAPTLSLVSCPPPAWLSCHVFTLFWQAGSKDNLTFFFYCPGSTVIYSKTCPVVSFHHPPNLVAKTFNCMFLQCSLCFCSVCCLYVRTQFVRIFSDINHPCHDRQNVASHTYVFDIARRIPHASVVKSWWPPN